MMNQTKAQNARADRSKAGAKKNEKEVLFIVKFELGDQLSDQIVFRKDDISEELA